MRAWIVAPLFLSLAACSAFPALAVKATPDFELTASGEAPAWRDAAWATLRRRQADGLPYETKFKMAYSPTGLYVLIEGSDGKLSAKQTKDFGLLFLEDVFEVFLWPDESAPLYFEYEISPLNRELPILVPNAEGAFYGWLPWNYSGERLTRHATATIGGPKEPGATIQGWRAEIFIPYKLLAPLRKVPPKAGERWRANVYRMDYDEGRKTQWDWAPVGPSFHEYASFGILLFE
jgi:hypothetical protein